MPVVFPTFTKAKGRRSLVAAIDAPVTGATAVADGTFTGGTLSLAALTAPGNSVNVSCYTFGNTSGALTAEPQRGEAPARACDIVGREEFGRTNFTVANLNYGYDPQGGPQVEANAAKEFLPPLSDRALVERLGKPAKVEDLAIDDIVSVYEVTVSSQNRQPTGDDDQAENAIDQAAVLASGGNVYHDVKIVA